MRNRTLVAAMVVIALGSGIAATGCQSKSASSDPGVGTTDTGARAAAPASPTDRLVGAWTLDRIEERTVKPMLPMGSKPPSLDFASDGRVTGFGGVNRLSGSTDPAGLAAGRIALSPMASTRMAGPLATMKVEAMFLEDLGKVTGYTFDANGDLLLTRSSGTLLRFVRADK